MTEILPTFSSNRDRLVYLLAEYKIPLTITFLSVGVWVAWASPELPTPPRAWVTFSLAWGALSIPSYAFGLRLVRWLYTRNWEYVAIADDGETYIYDAKRVPPDLWNEKTVVGAQPFQPDKGIFDYVVTRFNYYDDIDELEVRGCERADLTPGEALQSANRVDEYHEHHHTLRRQYSRMKGLVQDYASQIHDLTVMRMAAQREEAEMTLQKSVTDLIDEMESDVEDLPDGPAQAQETHGEMLDAQLEDLEIEAMPDPRSNGHDETADIAEVNRP